MKKLLKLQSKFNQYEILIIEDDLSILYSMERMFKAFKLNVQIAENGEKAIQVINNDLSKKIKLIITDINMPKKNGFETIKETISKRDDIKFIISSAHVEIEQIKNNSHLDIEEYLLKPIDYFEMINILNKVEISH